MLFKTSSERNGKKNNNDSTHLNSFKIKREKEINTVIQIEYKTVAQITERFLLTKRRKRKPKENMCHDNKMCFSF